jgi:hypothetical protein
MYIFFHSVCSYRIFLTKFSIKKWPSSVSIKVRLSL